MEDGAAGELNNELSHLSELAAVIGVEVDLNAVDAAAELDRVDVEFSKRITQYPESVQAMLQQRWQHAFQPVRAKVVFEEERLLKEAAKADAALKSAKEQARNARENAEEALTSAQTSAESVKESAKIIKKSANEILSITAEEKGRLLLSINESFGLSPNEILDMFEKLDSDNDGKINTAELTKLLEDPKVGLGKEAIRTVMESADRTGDGTLDPTEFIIALSTSTTLLSDHVKRTAQEVVNTDSDASESSELDDVTESSGSTNASVPESEDSTSALGTDSGDREGASKSKKETFGKKKKSVKAKKRKAKKSGKTGKEIQNKTSQTTLNESEIKSEICAPIIELIRKLQEENISSRRNQIIDSNLSERLRLLADVEIIAERAAGQRMPSGFTDGRRLTCSVGGQYRITLLTPASINKKMDTLNVGEGIDIGVTPSGWNLALNRLELEAVTRKK